MAQRFGGQKACALVPGNIQGEGVSVSEEEPERKFMIIRKLAKSAIYAE